MSSCCRLEPQPVKRRPESPSLLPYHLLEPFILTLHFFSDLKRHFLQNPKLLLQRFHLVVVLLLQQVRIARRRKRRSCLSSWMSMIRSSWSGRHRTLSGQPSLLRNGIPPKFGPEFLGGIEKSSTVKAPASLELETRTNPRPLGRLMASRAMS